jgi:hypothetical protein
MSRISYAADLCEACASERIFQALRLLTEKLRDLQMGDGEEIDDRKDSDTIHDNQDHEPDGLSPPARVPERQSFPKAFPQDQEWEGRRERMQARWRPEARPNANGEHEQ